MSAEIVVDATGLRCPMPVIKAAQVAAGAAPGTVLVVLSTDLASEHDLPAWARMRGHELLELTREPATGPDDVGQGIDAVLIRARVRLKLDED